MQSNKDLSECMYTFLSLTDKWSNKRKQKLDMKTGNIKWKFNSDIQCINDKHVIMFSLQDHMSAIYVYDQLFKPVFIRIRYKQFTDY